MKYFKMPTPLSLHALKKIYNELIDGLSDKNLLNLISNKDLKFRTVHKAELYLHQWFVVGETTANLGGVGYNVSRGAITFINDSALNGSENFCAKLTSVGNPSQVRAIQQIISLPKDLLENDQVTVTVQYRLRNGDGSIVKVGTGKNLNLLLKDYSGTGDYTEISALSDTSYHLKSEINTMQKVFAVSAPVSGSLQAKVTISVDDGAKGYFLEIISVTACTGKLNATSLLGQRDIKLDSIKYQNGSWQITDNMKRYFKINGLGKQIILVGDGGIEDNDLNHTPITIQAAMSEFGTNKVYVLTSDITLTESLNPPENSTVLGNGFKIKCDNKNVVLSGTSSCLRNVIFENVGSFTITGARVVVENCDIFLGSTASGASPIGMHLDGALEAVVSNCKVTEKILLENAKDCYIENTNVTVVNTTVTKNFIDLKGAVRNFISFRAILTDINEGANAIVVNLSNSSLKNTINVISYLDGGGGSIIDEEEAVVS